MSDVAQATAEATHWSLVRVKYAFQNISAWKHVLQKIMLHVKHDFKNICEKTRTAENNAAREACISVHIFAKTGTTQRCSVREVCILTLY